MLKFEHLANDSTPTFYPSPELPDATPIGDVQFSTRIRNALTLAGWETVGDIRQRMIQTRGRLPSSPQCGMMKCWGEDSQ